MATVANPQFHLDPPVPGRLRRARRVYRRDKNANRGIQYNPEEVDYNGLWRVGVDGGPWLFTPMQYY